MRASERRSQRRARRIVGAVEHERRPPRERRVTWKRPGHRTAAARRAAASGTARPVGERGAPTASSGVAGWKRPSSAGHVVVAPAGPARRSRCPARSLVERLDRGARGPPRAAAPRRPGSAPRSPPSPPAPGRPRGGARPDDRRLLGGDASSRVPEELLVVVVDARHHRDQRGPDVGRRSGPPSPTSSTATSTPRLRGSGRAPAPSSPRTSWRRRRRAAGRSARPSTTPSSAIAPPSTRMRSRHGDEVGRGVEPDAEAGRLEDGREQRRDRALAVGAADLDHAEPASGWPSASSSASMRSSPAASRRARRRARARSRATASASVTATAARGVREEREEAAERLLEVAPLDDAGRACRARGGTPSAGSPRAAAGGSSPRSRAGRRSR